MNNNLFQYLTTNLPIKKEIQFQVAKDNSQFAGDSGYDYDLRGFFSKYGNLTPTNGHLTDEFKMPNHPTFSNESKFYDGNLPAVNWQNKTWKTLSKMGLY